MGATIYKKAFSVELSHDFYETANQFNVNKLLEITPTAACADLMRNGRMRFVRTTKGFTVFYQAYLDESNTELPLVQVNDNAEFLFNVRLVFNPELFLNVTDLNAGGKTFAAGKKYFLQAKDTDPDFVLDESLIDLLCPSVLTYNFRGIDIMTSADYTDPVDITIKDEAGTTTLFTFNNVSPNPATGIYSQPLDFTGLPNGVYQVEAVGTTGGDPIVHQAVIYVDSALARENNFGLIRLRYADAGNMYDGEDVFTYAFANRTVRWRYFVSVREFPAGFFDADANYLEITDTDANYTFSPEDGMGKPSPTFGVNGLSTIIITSTGGGPGSDGKIPFSETAIKTFQLKQGGTVTKVLVNGLPNAPNTGVDSNQLHTVSVDAPYAELFLTISQLTTTI